MRLEESSNALAREVAEQRDRLEIIRYPTCVYIYRIAGKFDG